MEDSNRRNFPRFEVDSKVSVNPYLEDAAGRKFQFAIVDISIRGLGVKCAENLTAVADLWLVVHDQRVAVEVAWGKDEGRYGLKIVDETQDVIDVVYKNLQGFVDAIK